MGYLQWLGDFYVAYIPSQGECGHHHRYDKSAVACLSKWQMKLGLRKPWRPLPIDVVLWDGETTYDGWRRTVASGDGFGRLKAITIVAGNDSPTGDNGRSEQEAALGSSRHEP